MKILGAVLAGGQSSRFGSDKALAEIDGQSLLAIAVAALSRWCDTVIVVGRDDAPVQTIPDWPRPGMGPLAGVAAALRAARHEGFDLVLTVGVDSPGLPADLLELLSPAPAYLADQPVIGLWPACAEAATTTILESDGRHSLRAFAQAIGARAVSLGEKVANVNTPGDLPSSLRP